MKKALVTGIKVVVTGVTGQDGHYLTKLLLEKGYEVHGIVRRSSNYSIANHDGVYSKDSINNKNLKLHYGDLSDYSSIFKIINEVKPDEIYNLGAMSDVRVSFDMPEYTSDVTGLGVLRVIDAVKNAGLKNTKIYQASSSEMFGMVQETPQKETTPFHPRSPYAVSKVYGHWICKNYREAYGMFICSGILFNHESPKRGPNFVTRKITRAVASILAGKQDKLYLGNIDSKRDWGYAPEYVEAMWLMLQQDKPDDYVVATGKTHSVKEFLEEAFRCANLNWEDYVEINEDLYRPSETGVLIGDPTKARKELGWKSKITFKDLVKIMVEADIENLKK